MTEIPVIVVSYVLESKEYSIKSVYKNGMDLREIARDKDFVVAFHTLFQTYDYRHEYLW